MEGSELEPVVVTGEVVARIAELPDWPVIGDVMTNADYSCRTDIAERLRAGGAVGAHAARDFHGLVWFFNGLWYERVAVRGRAVASYQADDLKTLMVTVNGVHGWA